VILAEVGIYDCLLFVIKYECFSHDSDSEIIHFVI
jgi:hypothetical protein